MLLANCNVPDLVLEHVTRYLNESENSFTELKDFILNKKALPPIRSELISLLAEAKKTTESHVRHALEEGYYEKQIHADKKQQKAEHTEQLIDDTEKSTLERKLERLLTLKSNHASARLINIRKLNHLLTQTTPNVVVSGHPMLEQKPKKTQKINQLKELILNDENQMLALAESIRVIQKSLIKLTSNTKKRDTHEHRRIRREQARIGYQSSGEGLHNTLSLDSSRVLAKRIDEQQHSIHIKHNDLVNELEQLIYPCFIEQLTNQLAKMSLPSNEIEALNIILKLMKQHEQYEQNAKTTKDQLKSKKQLASSLNQKLRQHEGQLSSLRHYPDLIAANNELTSHNKEHTEQLERHTRLHKQFIMPTFLLLTFAFLCSIPLILTFGGVIPFFLAPALLYTLVAIPPALFVTASIATGTTSLVYYVKAHGNKTELITNNNNIKNNTKNILSNEEITRTLHEITIPALKAHIKKEDNSVEQLTQSLEQSKRQAKQAHQQAQNIGPLSRISIFSPNNTQLEKATLESEPSSPDDDLSTSFYHTAGSAAFI